MAWILSPSFVTNRKDRKVGKIGNHRVEIQGTEDYRFGWESAERGEPRPEWAVTERGSLPLFEAQRLGWDDYHAEQVTS